MATVSLTGSDTSLVQAVRVAFADADAFANINTSANDITTNKKEEEEEGKKMTTKGKGKWRHIGHSLLKLRGNPRAALGREKRNDTVGARGAGGAGGANMNMDISMIQSELAPTHHHHHHQYRKSLVRRTRSGFNKLMRRFRGRGDRTNDANDANANVAIGTDGVAGNCDNDTDDDIEADDGPDNDS